MVSVTVSMLMVMLMVVLIMIRHTIGILVIRIHPSMVIGHEVLERASIVFRCYNSRPKLCDFSSARDFDTEPLIRVQLSPLWQLTETFIREYATFIGGQRNNPLRVRSFALFWLDVPIYSQSLRRLFERDRGV